MEYKPTHPLEPGAHSAPNEARRKQELERGQAIVLIAFVMVGLIAMLGLSVDGGGILFLYRDARNATDAATLAAAYARCTNDDPNELYDAGLKTANDNGFNDNETDNFVDIHNPPLNGVGAGDSDYINVQIRAFKPSYFIQVVYPEPLWIATEATGFCRRPFDSSTVGAIFGLGTTDCSNGRVELSGADQTIIGDIFSNGNTKQTGSGNGLVIDGSAGTHSTFDPPNYSDKVSFVPPGTYTPGQTQRDNPFSWVDLNDYRPGGVIYDALEAKNPSQVKHITSADPDFKNGGWNPGNKATVGGFYMVEGNVTLQGIYVDQAIGLTVVATGTITVISPNDTISFYEPLLTLNDQDIPSIGFVFYSEFGDQGTSCANSANAIDVSTNNLNVTGVIYAPNGGIGGSFSSGFYKGALVGWRVSLSGSDTDIIRDPTLFPPQPPRVSIAQ